MMAHHQWNITSWANSSPSRSLNHKLFMKLYLICEKDGTIASIHTGVVSGPQAAISNAGITPGQEQTLHAVDATEELRGLSLAEIHRLFRVRITKEKVTLMRRQGS